MLKLEKDVPVPSPRVRKGKYPFADMVLGESFSVPIEQHNAVRTSAYGYGKRHGVQFTTRKRIENGKEVARVGRIK